MMSAVANQTNGLGVWFQAAESLVDGCFEFFNTVETSPSESVGG